MRNKEVEFTDIKNGSMFFRDSALTTLALYDATTNSVTHDQEGTAFIPSMDAAATDLLSETAISRVVFTDPERITEISRRFVAQCLNLTEFEVPENVTVIDNYAFADCTSLAKITFLGTQLKRIGGEAFRNTALTEINVPEGVEDMGDSRIFGGCKNLQTVILPSTLKLFCKTDAFKDCTALKSLTVLATYPPDVDGGDMKGGSMLKQDSEYAQTTLPKQDSEYAQTTLPKLMQNNGFVIYVPADSVQAYKTHRGTYNNYLRNAEGWMCYADAIVPMYSGTYANQSGLTVTLYQTNNNGDATVTVNGASYQGRVTSTTGENGVVTSVYTYEDGKTLTVSGLTLTMGENSLVRISGPYTDMRGDFGVNNVFEKQTVIKNGDEYDYEVIDYGEARKLQFVHQLHIQADGSVQIYEFDETRAYTEMNVYYDAAGNMVRDLYVHVYPATVYSGTYKIENGQIVMSFTDSIKYKRTYTFTTDNDAVVKGAVSFKLSVGIATVNTNGITAVQTGYLAQDHLYTR